MFELCLCAHVHILFHMSVGMYEMFGFKMSQCNLNFEYGAYHNS